MNKYARMTLKGKGLSKVRQASFGFSMVEMLVVMLVLVVLISMLLPVFMTGKRTAYQAACIGNQHKIHAGQMSYRLENKKWTNGSGWHEDLLPYVRFNTSGFKYEGSVYDCPEHYDPNLNENGVLASIQVHHRGNVYEIDIFEGPFGRKLSATQYEDLVDRYGVVQTVAQGNAYLPYWRNEYQGYVEDGQDHYWLLFEDLAQNRMPSGDQDFDDVIIKVTRLPNGQLEIQPRRAGAGAQFILIDSQSGEPLIDGYLSNWDTRSVVIGDRAFDYGMNMELDIKFPDQKIILTDYQRPLLDPFDPWEPGEYGRPDFVRHIGDNMVTLYVDGHVEINHYETVDPTHTRQLKSLWIK